MRLELSIFRPHKKKSNGIQQAIKALNRIPYFCDESLNIWEKIPIWKEIGELLIAYSL